MLLTAFGVSQYFQYFYSVSSEEEVAAQLPPIWVLQGHTNHRGKFPLHRRDTNVMNYFKVYVAQLQLITGESWFQPSVFCFMHLVSSACSTHITKIHL